MNTAAISNDYEKYRYSRIVDLCIYWAREEIGGGSSEDKRELESLLAECSEEPGVKEELGRGIKRLIRLTKDARECLWSDKSLYLTEEDVAYASILPEEYGISLKEIEEPGIAINLALRILDDAVYLHWALITLLPADLKDSVKNLVEEIDELVVSLTTDGQPPSHRLVPLNTLRRGRVDRIPEDLRFLFPWYEWHSSLPQCFLSVMAERMAGITCLDDESVKFDPGEMQILYDAIVNDDAMFIRIEGEALLWQELPKAFKEAWAWRLVRAAARYAARFTMPQKVLDAGAVGCAIRVACKAIIGRIPAVEWRLRAAFCGVGLTEEESLELLSPVEEEMNGGVLNEYGSVSKIISEWQLSKIKEDDLARNIFDDWLKDLEHVAEGGFVHLPAKSEYTLYHRLLISEEPGQWASLIMRIDKVYQMASWMFTRPESAISWFERILLRLLQSTGLEPLPLRLVPEGDLNDEETERQAPEERPLADVLPRAPLLLQEPTIGFGTSRIHFLLEDASRSLRERLGGVYFYWTCIAILGGDPPGTHKSQIRYQKLPISITPEDVGGDLSACQIVMLAISDNEKKLEQVLNQQEMPATEEGQLSRVYWVTYVKEFQPQENQ